MKRNGGKYFLTQKAKMAAFFQLLQERFGSRSFLIVQTAPIDSSIEDQLSSSGRNSTRDLSGASKEKNAAENSISDETKKENLNCKANENRQASVKLEVCNKSSVSKNCDVDLEYLYSSLCSSNNLEMRCKNSLELALCLSQDSCDIEFAECLTAINDLSDSHKHPHLAICHALLLCAFTKLSMSLKELSSLEESILSLAEAVLQIKESTRKLYKVDILNKHYSEVTLKLCQELFPEEYLDINEIDILTICCTSLCNLSSIIMQHDSELGAKYSYKNSTLMYVLEMTGKSTQEIVSEYMSSSQIQTCPSISSHRIKDCLQILEHALSINPDLSHCESLQHDNFSLPHCLTRLLGWSVSSLFPVTEVSCEDANANLYFKFHLSTLLCILKILSVMTFNPNQYDNFTNVKGLMEKILICTLKAYFESEKNHFDIQILCLEILINLYLKNQKTFILLCLKKFKINESEEVLAIEALIKMLSYNLEKIKEVKQSAPYPQVNSEDTSNQDSSKKETSTNSELVLQAASKDMEHSTIVSFICVLLVFFIRTKESFKDFIQERLTSEMLKEATTVSKKFLEFATITGGMPVTGILILTQTVNKLQALQP